MDAKVHGIAPAVMLAISLLASSGVAIGQPSHLLKAHPHVRRPNPGPGWDRPQVLQCLYLGEPTHGLPNRILVKENPVSWKAPIFELDFITDWPAAPRTLLVYPEGYSFIDAFMLDDDILISFWSAADTGVMQAFHLVKGGATMVFEKSRWGTVETWHSTILLDESAIGSDGNYHYTTTQIWQWTGKQYKLAGTVPYHKRLEALAKLSHEVEK